MTVTYTTFLRQLWWCVTALGDRMRQNARTQLGLTTTRHGQMTLLATAHRQRRPIPPSSHTLPPRTSSRSRPATSAEADRASDRRSHAGAAHSQPQTTDVVQQCWWLQCPTIRRPYSYLALHISKKRAFVVFLFEINFGTSIEGWTAVHVRYFF